MLKLKLPRIVIIKDNYWYWCEKAIIWIKARFKIKDSFTLCKPSRYANRLLSFGGIVENLADRQLFVMTGRTRIGLWDSYSHVLLPTDDELDWTDKPTDSQYLVSGIDGELIVDLLVGLIIEHKDIAHYYLRWHPWSSYARALIIDHL